MANRNKFDQRGVFIRFNIPGAKLPGQETPVPDLLVKSYWQSFSLSAQQKITRKKTLGGWTEDHWPADLDTLSVEGSTGAFILIGDGNIRSLQDKSGESQASSRLQVDTPFLTSEGSDSRKVENTQNRGRDYGLATGDQVFLRRLSEASLNLEAIADFYRSNGATFEKDGQVAAVKDIDMYYMGDVYRGYFTEFSHTHSSDIPNLFTYSFTFRVRESFMTEVAPTLVSSQGRFQTHVGQLQKR